MKLEIVETTFSTTDSITIAFKGNKTIDYKPGQHGVFTFDINGEKLTRTYSFHTLGGIDSNLAITIRSVENGKVSNFIRTNKIKEVELETITGSFFLEPSPETKRHLVMLAAGSGITPIMAMIRGVLYKESQSSITLIYSNRNYQRIIFRNELNQLEHEFPNRLKIHHVLTQDENIPADFPVFHAGRLPRLVIRKLIKTIQSQTSYPTEYYLCGPFPFMELIEDSLGSLSIDRTKIYKEHFFIPEARDASIDFSNLPPREILLKLGHEEKLLVVDGGKSILQAALQNNIRLTHSCTEGQCGMCRAYVLNGEVRLRKNHVLTAEELNAGQVLLCQGFPVSDDISIKPIN
jgi:ring-1,2-phenylacetyl-CoA epoxidase subunit PaaE